MNLLLLLLLLIIITIIIGIYLYNEYCNYSIQNDECVEITQNVSSDIPKDIPKNISEETQPEMKNNFSYSDKLVNIYLNKNNI